MKYWNRGTKVSLLQNINAHEKLFQGIFLLNMNDLKTISHYFKRYINNVKKDHNRVIKTSSYNKKLIVSR